MICHVKIGCQDTTNHAYEIVSSWRERGALFVECDSLCSEAGVQQVIVFVESRRKGLDLPSLLARNVDCLFSVVFVSGFVHRNRRLPTYLA